MNLRKILAASAAVAVASAMAVSASAYDTFLMYADADWFPSSMSFGTCPAGDIDVSADGTYTVSVTDFLVEDEETGEMVPTIAEGATVFCVDMLGLAADYGAGMGADGYDTCETGADKMAFAQAAGITISDVSIQTANADGSVTDIAVDASKIIYGDIEGNGNLRIEIYNAYGDTSANAPIDPATISFDDSMSVTFTISGIGGTAEIEVPDVLDEEPADTVVDTDAATEDNKGGSPDTGVEGVAAVAGLAVLAAGAALVSKKRK